MSAPALTEDDIQLEVERIFSKERRSCLTALYGTGESGTVTVNGKSWRVIPTRCEIEMRADMPVPGRAEEQGDDRIVFLVDWTARPLPLDLSCRLAAGRVFQMTRSTRLAVIFGARQTAPGLMGTGLASVLLAGEVSALKKVSGLLLTRADAYRRFMDAGLGFPLDVEMTPASVAAWCAGSEAGPGFVRRGEESDAWRQLRGEVAAFAQEHAGPLAALAWTAWESGLGARFLQLAVLVEAHARVGDPVAEGVLQGRLEELAPGFGAGLLAQRQDLVDSELIEDSLDALGEKERLELLDGADHLIGIESFAGTRQASPWLRSGHRRREADLAEALTEAVGAGSWEALREVRAALGLLEGHYLDDPLLRTDAQRETRVMAVRLAGYLVERRQAPPPPEHGAAHQRAVDLAKDFASQGGFVDWCRQRLRAPLPFDPALNQAAHAVLKAADAVRREDNRQFAEGLLRWIEAGRPATEVTPIERATRQLVGELLSSQPRRKILVVMMDGMSWANAVQLLSRLEQEKWRPIAWRPKGHTAQLHLPPILTDLPTLTQVSRAAFFAGRRDRKSGNQATAEDARRWAANPHLAKLTSEELPPLVLRQKLMAGEELHEDVKRAVDGQAPVVGVVVNAIDEELLGSTQVVQDYSHLPIKPLTGLLEAAAGAERIVLLASDHGHVPGDAMTPHGQPSPGKLHGGRRWRSLGPDDELREHEIRMPADTWRPPGTEGVAAIWDEQVSNSHPGYGEHGGVALAEVVAPAVLIAPEWLAQAPGEDGAALETRPFPEPEWWDPTAEVPTAEVPGARARATDPGDSDTPRAPAEPVPLFPELFPPRAAAPAVPEPRPEPPLVQALRTSKVFKAHVQDQPPDDVDRILEWLAALVEAGGRLSDREFARRCHDRPHRVAGLVARMGILNCDGYAMVEHDLASRQVVLHESRLVQNYGLRNVETRLADDGRGRGSW